MRVMTSESDSLEPTTLGTSVEPRNLSSCASTNEVRSRTAKPLGKRHHARKTDQRSVGEICQHGGRKATNFAGDLTPCHPLHSPLGVESGVHGRRVEPQNLRRSRPGQLFRRRGRLITSGEEALRRAATPAQDLEHDSARHRPLGRHGPDRARADRYGRGVLERLVDLGGQADPTSVLGLAARRRAPLAARACRTRTPKRPLEAARPCGDLFSHEAFA